MVQKKRQKAFTLIELLVVIAIIALLLSITTPALRKAKESAKSLVCRNNLKTLATANAVYAAKWDNWYVPAIDTTMTSREEATWNSNSAFRDIVGLKDAYIGSSFKLPKQYLCPADKQSSETYWSQAGVTYQNFVSYGYNLTDWGPDSVKPAAWSGNIPTNTWSCRIKIDNLRTSATKIMFTDGGDIWARKDGADYKNYWDNYGQDIVKYRAKGIWYPAYYRHKEGANVAYFDCHVDFRPKEQLFCYTDDNSLVPDDNQNVQIWYCDTFNRKR